VQPITVKIFSIIALLFVSGYLQGQDRCGTVEYMKLKAAQHQIREKNEVFERWLGERNAKLKKEKSTQRTQATYVVPVVVHVIYNLDPNSGLPNETNIPDTQIESQIKVLNNDFKRTNSDANLTPADFQSLAGAMDVEFVLAKQDPQGLPTNGIVRVQGTQSSWSINDNYKLKALSYWPAEDYLNIWVCKLTGYIGYAQFPQTDLLSGLENASTNRLTDGVVITYNAFGSDDDGDFNLQSRYNKGRTTTHEVGHFFGLRHIWGDQDGCGSVGDYVDDTPDQDAETTGCPTHPKTACNNAIMFQNYLDYTNDVCMNLFSKGQVERMVTVIENSPRRLSLLTSHGSSAPSPIPDNLSIMEILSPLSGTCSGTVTPEINVINHGTNEVTSAEIVLRVNDNPVETKTFTITLAPSESATLSFASTIIPGGTATFTFEILTVNTVEDLDDLNNIKTQTVFLPANVGIPFAEDFSPFPSGWTIQNPDAGYTWQVAGAPKEETNNKAMKMDFFSYEDNFGEVDLLITPTFDLTNAPYATVLFDVSYAQFQGSNDGLQVIALDACNPDITKGTVLFSKSGAVLSTDESTSESYAPSDDSDWRTESIDLTAYLGQSNVQLAFVGINDYGNNLYLDDVKVVTELVNNLTLQDVISPGPVTCNSSLSPQLQVRNSGSPVSSFTIDYVVNGVEHSHEITNAGLSFGDVVAFTLPPIALDNEINTMTFTIRDPNGNPDVNIDDNTLTWQAEVNHKTATIPLEERFESNFSDRWVSINPTGERVWEPVTLDGNTALKFEGYNYDAPDSRSWLVSPAIDLSGVDSVGLAFDVSYITRDGGSDALLVYTSTNCGESFSLLQTYSHLDLSVGEDDAAWTPSDKTDWITKEISLKEELADQRDARIALVFRNAGVNNLYLDNIRVVAGSTVEIKRGFEVFPNPLMGNDKISVTFNLPQSEDIVIQIFDAMGRVVFTEEKTGVMDQTDVLYIGQLSGMYTMKVITPKKVYARKFISVR
jgi:hypothetical protein